VHPTSSSPWGHCVTTLHALHGASSSARENRPDGQSSHPEFAVEVQGVGWVPGPHVASAPVAQASHA
jgi:hypothetical protein